MRGQRVMPSQDLAALYGVEPKTMMQAVKRNMERLSADSMFQLTYQEVAALKSQIVASSWGKARRATPYAFTQEGVAMLSGVLRSARAVRVNIDIMRAFVRLRALMQEHADLARKLAELEKRYDTQFKSVFDAIREPMAPVPNSKRPLDSRGRNPKKARVGKCSWNRR